MYLNKTPLRSTRTKTIHSGDELGLCAVNCGDTYRAVTRSAIRALATQFRRRECAYDALAVHRRMREVVDVWCSINGYDCTKATMFRAASYLEEYYSEEIQEKMSVPVEFRSFGKVHH